MKTCRSFFNICAKAAIVVGSAALSSIGGTQGTMILLTNAGFTPLAAAPFALAVGISYGGITTQIAMNALGLSGAFDQSRPRTPGL